MGGGPLSRVAGGHDAGGQRLVRLRIGLKLTGKVNLLAVGSLPPEYIKSPAAVPTVPYIPMYIVGPRARKSFIKPGTVRPRT